LAVVGAIPMSVIAFADEEKTNAAAPRTAVAVEGTVTYTGPLLGPIADCVRECPTATLRVSLRLRGRSDVGA
jgi:hypothetical protein